MRLISSWARTSSRFKLLWTMCQHAQDLVVERLIPLFILDVLFLQLDILELARELLEVGILVGTVCRRAFEVLDAWDGGWDALLELGVVDRAFDQYVPHLDWWKLEVLVLMVFRAGFPGTLVRFRRFLEVERGLWTRIVMGGRWVCSCEEAR